MKLSATFRALTGAKTSIALAFICACAAAAQTVPAQGFKNVVLVHGAWADGSSWAGVIPLLEATGLNVVALQLPLTSLADDVAVTSPSSGAKAETNTSPRQSGGVHRESRVRANRRIGARLFAVPRLNLASCALSDRLRQLAGNSDLFRSWKGKGGENTWQASTTT